MKILAVFLLLALSRAEILARMRAPVVTQADGFVQVFADCGEDLRREFQFPVARSAAEIVRTLSRAEKEPPRRFRRAPLVIHLGDVRTNLTEVAVRTGGDVTRLYLRSPAHADLVKFQTEVVKAYFRHVHGKELDDGEAVRAYRAANPALRIADQRDELERWLAGVPAADGTRTDAARDERAIALMRKVIEPGVASRRDILVFASRLRLYPPEANQSFEDGCTCLDFRAALARAPHDPRVRFAARQKCGEPALFGGGRGLALCKAAQRYTDFLVALADASREPQEARAILDDAETLLNIAFEEARTREEGN